MFRMKLRGHEIETLDGVWVYSDTLSPSAGNERQCGFCDKKNTPEGHDGCLGTLPGIMNACCGHGSTNEAYVQLLDGHGIYGEDAVSIIEILKKRT